MTTNDYRIFMGAFLWGDLAAQVQAVRAHYDPQTARITPPHVTLAGTYWRSGPPTPENEADTLARLAGVTGHIAAFDLILSGIYTFPPVEKPVIYLGVEPTAALLAARRQLIAALGADKHHDFVPHLTLAMRLDAPAARAMQDDLRETAWVRETFTLRITELWLMQRGPIDPAWRQIGRLLL
jgi:2'-5' RNA ligase